ncbi:hypothetical protein VTK73DRAFT_3723 [Phialemonium thermophilum]|uniref:Secreted protein n=1 Tax=Phialemonium thermophilum TaxID=223376 RepID=A0ABR3VFB7_9PEZI
MGWGWFLRTAHYLSWWPCNTRTLHVVISSSRKPHHAPVVLSVSCEAALARRTNWSVSAVLLRKEHPPMNIGRYCPLRQTVVGRCSCVTCGSGWSSDQSCEQRSTGTATYGQEDR